LNKNEPDSIQSQKPISYVYIFGKRFGRGKIYINGLESFWSFAIERLVKFHSASKEKFPLYLKEMEFRYNHRGVNLFQLFAQKLCELGPF